MRRRLLRISSAARSRCNAPSLSQNTSRLAEIPIGGEGGWDILTIDDVSHRLYLSHTNTVVVIDLEKNAVAGADTADFEPAPSRGPVASSGRPSIVPNTMKLLVYGPAEAAK